MNMLQKQSIAEMKRVLRNKYFVLWSLIMPIAFYYFFTNVVNTNVPDQRAWEAHYLMSMTVFSVMGSSIMTLASEWYKSGHKAGPPLSALRLFRIISIYQLR